ncbi:bifunctional DNA-formamidopyrimidine glycosylase/DNA-(apurinic or apyrimidinic site) lyase [Fibrobacterota bacterium]
MPELPEVETIRRLLAPDVANLTIAGIRVRRPQMVIGLKPRLIAGTISGQKITDLIRRGKYIVFELEKDALIFHLGMTGQLLFSSQWQNRSDKHVRIIISFTGNRQLLFKDPRTFGKIICVPGGDWRSHPRIQKLGPEPLDITPGTFLKHYIPHSSHRSIKSLLLDQSFLSGIGNIYCDETLFLSGLHPARTVDTLSQQDWRNLIRIVKKVLQKAIKNLGTSFSDYRKPDGSLGSNQEQLQVYGRGGKECYACGAVLLKTSIAQRGTVYCPECQAA